MKTAVYPYALQSKGCLNSKTKACAHAGFLIRVAFDDDSVGYADCHPWPELGDSPVDFHLELLKQGHTTQLLKRSYSFALLDAKSRKKGASLFESLSIPQSHALLTDLEYVTPEALQKIIKAGFKRVKLKATKESVKKVKFLLDAVQDADVKFRIDFNCSLTKGEFHQVLFELKTSLETIEFFEDPVPFHLSTWRDFQEAYSISLACDREAIKALGFPEAAKYLVVKPAIQELEPFLDSHQTIIITTYADHPIGQFSAAWAAACFKGRLGICGLLSHHAYEHNPFSHLIKHKGPYLTAPEGTGLGFDDLLEALPWEAMT